MPWRLGGRVGFTVDAAAFPDSSGHTLEVYVRVPPATLAALTLDSTATGRVRVSARLKSGFGGKGLSALQEFELAPGDSSLDFGRVVLMSFPLRSGPQKLAVRLEDVRSRKRGLVYLGRKVAESAEVEGEFTVSVPRTGIDLSDLEFVWPEAGGREGSTFLRSERRVLPNPERLYGLHANDLRASFTARRGDPERAWHWIARILDPEGASVAERESTQAGSVSLDEELAFDLTHEAAGGYELDLRVWQEGDSVQATRRARFSVAWRSESWFRNPRDIEDSVHLLLQPDDEDAFALMQPGEREHFLDEFWRVRDPSPGTALNEALVTFQTRAVTANRTYTRLGSGPGMLTDMGRVFIRYGEPSEILRQVLPAGESTLQQQLHDLSLNEDRAVGDVEQKGPGGDMRPFEVWIYEGDIPPPVDADPREARVHRKRLVFLFVDGQGLGEYTLRYSTE